MDGTDISKRQTNVLLSFTEAIRASGNSFCLSKNDKYVCEKITLDSNQTVVVYSSISSIWENLINDNAITVNQQIESVANKYAGLTISEDKQYV